MDPVRANRILVGLAVSFLLAGVSGCSTAFERRFDEAEALRQQAAQRGYEWIGTAGLLDQARAAADRGDTDAALQLVEQARFQADAALRQADYEAKAWRDRVVRKKE
jgi:hypothetical protein